MTADAPYLPEMRGSDMLLRALPPAELDDCEAAAAAAAAAAVAAGFKPAWPTAVRPAPVSPASDVRSLKFKIHCFCLNFLQMKISFEFRNYF